MCAYTNVCQCSISKFSQWGQGKLKLGFAPMARPTATPWCEHRLGASQLIHVCQDTQPLLSVMFAQIMTRFSPQTLVDHGSSKPRQGFANPRQGSLCQIMIMMLFRFSSELPDGARYRPGRHRPDITIPDDTMIASSTSPATRAASRLRLWTTTRLLILNGGLIAPTMSPTARPRLVQDRDLDADELEDCMLHTVQ